MDQANVADSREYSQVFPRIDTKHPGDFFLNQEFCFSSNDSSLKGEKKSQSSQIFLGQTQWQFMTK